MTAAQINIFGGEDIVESTIDLSGYSALAVEHIRTLQGVFRQVPIVNDTRLAPEEQKYIAYLREKVSFALGRSM